MIRAVSWLQRLLRPAHMEPELGYRVEWRATELIQEGIDPKDAARRVRIEFGSRLRKFAGTRVGLAGWKTFCAICVMAFEWCGKRMRVR